MFIDRLELTLEEMSRKYEEEKEHSRKLREKIIKVEKERAIEKRRVKYYQSRHLKTNQVLENITSAAKEPFELIELD